MSLFQGIIYWGINDSYLDYIFRYKLQNEITFLYHKKISTLDIAYYEDPEVQNLMSKTRETMQWRIPDSLRFLSHLFNNTIGYLTAFVVLIPYGWWIPVVISVIAIPRLYLQAKYGAIQWSIWGSGAPQAKKLWYLDYVLQDPITVRETRISQSSERLLGKFKQIQEDLFKLSKKGLDKYLKVLSIPPLFEAAAIFLVALKFLPTVIAGAVSIGTFTLIINMLEELGSRAANASSLFSHIYQNNLYVNHYFEFLNLKPLLEVSESQIKLESIDPPRIEFKNVSFNYPNGEKVLNNVSFVIEPGESVAFVGHNGAGKTTIVKLLCRFYDVSEGEILINGINILHSNSDCDT